MKRIMLAAAIAALVTFFIGFALHGSGLQSVAYGQISDAQAAAVQSALRDNLPNTATYIVPDDSSDAQMNMYEQGPTATIHFVEGGAPLFDPVALALWVVLAAAVAAIIGIGLHAQRSRVGSPWPVICFAVAAAAYIRLGEPILYHLNWRYFLYHFATDALVLAAIGLIMSRWGSARSSQAARTNEDLPTP